MEQTIFISQTDREERLVRFQTVNVIILVLVSVLVNVMEEEKNNNNMKRFIGKVQHINFGCWTLLFYVYDLGH